MDIGDHTGTLSLRQDDALENFGPIAFTTSTPSNPTRRSGRKSWFDNLGNAGKGTKYEIAVEKTVKRRSVCRRKSEDDDIETLTLTHFTNPPRISFGRAKPGTIKRRSLLIKNPHEHSQDVVVEKFPFKKHFDIDETKFTVEAEGTLLLTITWSPEDEGNFREMILLHVDGSYRLQAFVFGTVEKPPQKKKVRKGLMGKATKKPFAVIHTTSLANIAKSYSPTKGEARKSGEGRKRLSKGRENKVSVKKTQVKQDNSYPKPKQHSAQVTEFVDGGLDSNIKISHITPIKPVEDPVISAAEFVVPKVVKMPGKSSVNKLQGDFQEELECLSPLVAKYLDNSDDDVIVVRQTVNSEDQKNQLNTPDRMMLASNKISSSATHDTPKSTVQGVEPHKSKLNTSNKVDVVERKTPDKENQWFDQEGKADALSPNSFLQDSLCSQRGVDTSLYDAVSTISRQPAHSTILPTPERMSCANQHKDFISPNKFLKELNDTQERLELSLQHDPDTILSPESILNSSIPHAIMVKQLQTVKMSLASPNPPVFSPMSNKRETFVLKSNLSINQSPALRRETFRKGRTVTESKPFSSSSRNALFTQQGKQKTNTKKKDTKPRVDSNNLRKKSKEDCENLYKKTNCENGKFSQDWINGVSSSKAIPVSPLPTNIPSTGIHQGAINTPELLLNSQAITDSVSLKTTDGNTLSGKTFTPSGVVSLNTKSTILETPANLTVDTPVAEMLSVRVPAISMQLPCDIRTGKHDRMSQDSLEGSVLALDTTTVMKEKTLNDITPERQTSTGKRLLTPENEVLPPQDCSFQSPSNLPEDTPMREVFTRRTTLTVTKEKPSDALLQVTKKHISSQLNTEDKAITSDNTVHNLTNGSPRLHTAVPEENPERCISILLRNSTTSHPVEHTPTDVSVRSIDNKTSSFTTTPHQLPTSPNPDNSRRSTHVIEKPKVLDLSIIGRKRLFPPLEDSADESVTQKDNLTTVTVAATSSTLDFVPVQLATDHSDNVTLDISRHTKQASEEKSQDEGIPSNDEVSLKSDLGKSCVPDIGDEEKQKVDITSVKQSPDKMVTISQERKPYVAFITGSPVDPPSKQPRVTNRSKEIVKKRTHSENRAVDRVDNKRLRSTGTINTGMSGRSQTVSSLPHSTTRPRPATASKRDNKTGGPLRTSSKFKSSQKGVAQTKLILMKKSHPTALPKHPMPFASKNMYYDERWIDKQERGFVHWLNFVLTPAEEYQHSNKQVKVDAGALSVEASRASVKLAPSKEVLSIRAYTARRRLNQLRRGACNLFQTKEIICVIQKLEAEIESLRLVIRKDKKVHADLGMKQDILDMILSFNPLWLRIGLETVYGEMIPMQNNTDVISMSRFIVTRLLSNPDIASEYCHPTVPHLYRDGYAEAIAQHLLKKVFMLIYFLDKAKSHRLINHDPCLFCKDSEFKSTKAMLIQFSRNYLSGEGDVTKHLGYLGYVVTHQQTSMDEFDYAVTNLATDLRDGVRLTRVLELLTNHWDLSRSLRAPAISRLQKVHNMEVVFKALTTQGVTFDKEKKITTKDIVDGHREKTLHVLWALILQYQVDVLLNKEKLREEINILQRSLYVRNQLAALQRYEQGLSKKRRESSEQDLHLQSDSLLLLLRWCRTVCAFYNIKIENFTVSFGDGRAMCALVHHYHPALLPWNSINTKTTLTYQDTLDEEMCSRNQDLNSSEVFSPAPFPVAEDPVLFEEFLSNEKANFKLLYEKVSELGGIPLMLRSMDMSNTIPDEKVVVTYICYLCARLLDIRHESRAARVIQLAWRRHYLRKSKKELQMKHDAAIVIQRAARRFLSSRQAVRRNEGAKVIQKHVRVWLARRTIAQLRAAKEERCRTNAACVLQVAVRKWLKKQMTKKETAAVRIQAAWRCHRERKRFRQIKSACVIIQNQARMYLQRSRYGKVRQAVICIQRRYRAHHSMTSHRKEFLQIRSAAITIQSRYQSLVQRRLFLRLRASAVKIQATVRTWIDRRRYLSLRLATINIQRHYRARQKSAEVRKEFLLQKQAAVLIQAHFRSYTVRKNRKHLHAAAVVIQSRFKRLHDRKRYLKVRSAVVTLQRWIRAVTQGRKARSDFKKVRSSVVKIQSVYRSHRARSDFLTKRSAAITLQAHIRGHQKMEAFKKLKAAAINIQRRFRAQREGERVRRQFLVQKGATMTIQAFYRGHKVRQHIKCQHLAATKIQAVFKGHVQRNIFLRWRKAALIIQQKVRAKFEGNIVRKEFLIKKGAAMTIQAHFRGHMIRKNIKRLHAAAVVIQSHFKGLQDRKRYLRVRSAVVTLQRWTRAITQSRKARSEFKKVRSSVVKIQSVYRSHKARSDFLTKRSAAITIQAHIRGHQKMEAFRKLKAAAVNVQRRFRAHREGERVRRQFLVQKGATMTIQAFYRGHKVRQHIKCQHSSATKIQAVFKGHVQRNMFLRVRKAALIIQQKVRATFEGNRVREEFLTKKSAVLTIQAYFRGHVVRQEVATMNSAASMIQSKVKGYLQRKRFLRLKGAVLVIQQRFAAQLVGRRLRQEFLVRKGAAMTIQAAYRGYTVRKELDRYNNAAVILQSFYRAHRATTLYKQQRTASIHIQQWYRNLMFTRQIKAEYFRMRAAAVTIQAWYRCQKAVQALKMDKSRVITAQAVVRGFLQRRRFVKLSHAAVLIQRRFVARRQCINMRRAFLIKKGAAMTIQAAFRGYLVRRGLKRMHAAAVIIQSSYRTHQAVLSYSKQRKAVTTIQSWYRNWLYSRTVRSDYLSKKNAAVVIQKHYRCFLARRTYLRELSNIILVQALVRGVLQRIAFRRLQWAVTVCQTQYRSMLASHQQRCWFQNLRSAAIVFQSAWRKRRAQMMYIKTRQAVILLQSHVRMIQERKHFCQLKAVTIRCQKLVRSKRQMQECRKDYLITLGAVITIQAHVKSYLVQKQYHATLRSVICIQAHVRRFLAQRQYRKVYNNVVAVQTRFKANIAAKKQRSLFLVQRKAAIVIQTAFRKQQARRHMQRVRSAIVIQKTFRMFVTRQDFMRQKNAAIVLQSHHRACIARREKERRKLAVVSLQRAMRMFLFRQRLRQWMQRRNEAAMKIQCCLRGYLARRWVRKTKSAIVIQSVYRMYHQRNLYRRTTKSIVLLQSALRGTLARRRVNHTRTQHSAATCIQNAYRSFKRRQAEQVLRRRRMRYLHKFSEVVSAHLSAMKIQRCYRNYRVLLVAQQRLNTIIIIQRWMKAKLARMRFLRFVSAVRVVQARARQHLHLRQASVIKLQAVVRSWLARRWIVRREESVIKLQSIWRGRKVRKAYRSKKFETIRKNLKEATKSATEDRKLGNRTESALDYLLKYKQLSQILEALIHLETSTRLSPACCQRMVNVNAVGVIYRLIQSCNRSQPHMEIIRYSINILLNLAKYEKTRSAVYEVEGATECLLELMQVYREKGHIFSCSCTLMGILGMMDDKKQMVLADKKMTGKILSIYTLTSRKHKITENRMIRQAKISAAKSFNASLPILTLQKRQNRIHPDWVLQRNQMRHIEDPLQAIKFVLDNFQLTPK